MKINFVGSCAVVLTLSGCATYILDGQSFNSAEQFQLAATTLYSDTRQHVVTEMRVAAPLSRKTLLVGVPITSAINDAYSRLLLKPGPVMDNLSIAARKEFAMLAEIVRDLGIYQAAKITDTTGVHLQPSSTETVLYYYLVPEGAGGGQWYINGGRSGLQAVNIDRGQPNILGRAKSFVSSVQGYALTD